MLWQGRRQVECQPADALFPDDGMAGYLPEAAVTQIFVFKELRE
ncbi:hypothetical protein BER2_4333 [plant metagenome]|uniref:Uncharacterized protein n=1 Tax=plant metagenome TaxID=1297885 RepID=A0A484RFH3_9ZZZZ